ncbi:hypothetical protein [Vibrio sp. MA40-2]|uniref:hypothetical protein n=1 Tax=Vibrio sp. MA40-2 TaxID=3391828 RepID=UPI0039A77123
MSQHKLILALMGCSIALAGCGGDSSNDTGTTGPITTSNNVTITAMDGYLYKAHIYKQDGNGNCLTDGESLGTTDSNGQLVVTLSDLADGYCAVTTSNTIDQDFPNQTLTENYTLYSPSPRLIDSTDAPVISPLTTYIHNAMEEAESSNSNVTEQERIDAAEQAKTQLADALGLDGNDDSITDLLASDYVAMKTQGSDDVQEAAKNLHVMAQLLVQLFDEDSSVNVTQTINIAKSAATVLDNIADDPTSSANRTYLENIAIYVENRIDKFGIEDFESSSSLSELSSDISNASKLAEMPQRPSVEGSALKSLFEHAISAQVAAVNDNTVNLVLPDFSISGITEDSYASYVLTRKKVGAIWDAETITDASQSNGKLNISGLTFNQHGSYDFQLTSKKVLSGFSDEDETFESAPVTFTVDVTETQVANSAPVFSGTESETATSILNNLISAAEAESAYDPGFVLDGVVYVEPNYSFQVKSQNMAEMFTDDSGDLVTVDQHLNPSDFQGLTDLAFLIEVSTGMYSFNTGSLPLAEDEADTYRVTFYATDSLGAKSDTGLQITIAVNTDNTGSVTITKNNTNDNSSVVTPEYSETFRAVLMTSAKKDQIRDTIIAKLNHSSLPNVAVNQVYEITEQACSNDGVCTTPVTIELGSGSSNDLVFSLSSNSYIGTTEGSGNLLFSAIDTNVTTPETAVLSATLNGETVKIYEVDTNENLTSEIGTYGEQFEFIINSASDVTVNISGGTTY